MWALYRRRNVVGKRATASMAATTTGFQNLMFSDFKVHRRNIKYLACFDYHTPADAGRRHSSWVDDVARYVCDLL